MQATAMHTSDGPEAASDAEEGEPLLDEVNCTPVVMAPVWQFWEMAP